MLTSCDKHDGFMVVYDTPFIQSCPVCRNEGVKELEAENAELEKSIERLENKIRKLENDREI